MKIDLQAKLFQRYPRFFRRPRRLNATDPNIGNVGPLDYWGIECGNGWYSLIDDLARQYEEHIQELVAQRVPKRSWPRALQIKEKLGGLRIYTSNAQRRPASLTEAIEKAAAASAAVCESCGRPGTLRTKDYYFVACDECSKPKKRADSTDTNDDLLQLRAVLAARGF